MIFLPSGTVDWLIIDYCFFPANRQVPARVLAVSETGFWYWESLFAWVARIGNKTGLFEICI